MQLGKIAIDLPDAWEDRSLYTFVAPVQNAGPQMRAKASGFRKNVVIQRRELTAEETMDSCVEAVVERTKETFGEVKIDVADGPVTEAMQSRRVTYTVIDNVTNSAVAQVVYLCLLGHDEWQVAFSMPALDVDGELAGLDAMVATLRLA